VSREIATEIAIRAPADRVWGILTDFAVYPSWNPFVREVHGTPGPGERLRIVLARKGSSTMRFAPRVLVARAPEELRWLGRLWLPGLFDGEHQFTIVPDGTGGVRFVQRETFRGILVPLLWRSLDRETRAMFGRMNEALKARAESLTS